MSKRDYTQLPNRIIALMPVLKESELRVVLAVARQTWGHQQDWAPMSFTLFHDMTGMHRPAITRGITAALNRKIIQRRAATHNGQDTFEYGLVVSLENYPVVPLGNQPEREVVSLENHLPTEVVPLENQQVVSLGNTLKEEYTREGGREGLTRESFLEETEESDAVDLAPSAEPPREPSPRSAAPPPSEQATETSVMALFAESAGRPASAPERRWMTHWSTLYPAGWYRLSQVIADANCDGGLCTKEKPLAWMQATLTRWARDQSWGSRFYPPNETPKRQEQTHEQETHKTQPKRFSNPGRGASRAGPATWFGKPLPSAAGESSEPEHGTG